MAEVEGYDFEGFGSRIEARRKELGLSQTQFADQVGVALSAVTRWEVHNVLPREAETVVRIAVALDRSVGWVLGERRDAAFLDGVRLALDHIRRVATEERHRLDFETDDMLIEMKTGYTVQPVRRVVEAPPVPMETVTPPPGPQRKSKRAADQAG
jgi:transcriptional regulator with XRE-family HTH domain